MYVTFWKHQQVKQMGLLNPFYKTIHSENRTNVIVSLEANDLKYLRTEEKKAPWDPGQGQRLDTHQRTKQQS